MLKERIKGAANKKFRLGFTHTMRAVQLLHNWCGQPETSYSKNSCLTTWWYWEWTWRWSRPKDKRARNQTRDSAELISSKSARPVLDACSLKQNNTAQNVTRNKLEIILLPSSSFIKRENLFGDPLHVQYSKLGTSMTWFISLQPHLLQNVE